MFITVAYSFIHFLSLFIVYLLINILFFLPLGVSYTRSLFKYRFIKNKNNHIYRSSNCDRISVFLILRSDTFEKV